MPSKSNNKNPKSFSLINLPFQFNKNFYKLLLSFCSSKFSLRKRPSSSTNSWTTIVTTGKSGGSHTVFVDMEVGEQAAIFIDNGSLSTSSHTFSGYRVSKKWWKDFAYFLFIFPLKKLFFCLWFPFFKRLKNSIILPFFFFYFLQNNLALIPFHPWMTF